MSRQQAPGPPPGIFGNPGSADMWAAWLIPTVAAIVVSGACGVWLAGEVSYWAGDTPRPGRPLSYLKALIGGRAAWPDAWGWAALAVGAAVLSIGLISAIRLVAVRHGRAHRADRVARYLAPRRDRVRLGTRARAVESARLGGAWAGSPLGRIIPGGQLAVAGPEDVSVDVWGARAGKTTKRVIPAILDAPGAVLATSNKRDMSDATLALRTRRGVTWLFDPQGLASDGVPAFTYDLLGPVTDVSAAQKLAAIFEASTREPGARTDAHWDTAGRDLLAWLFLAAAGHRLPVGQVWEWLANPDDAAPAMLLRQAGHAGPATAVEGVLGQPDKMRGSTYGTAQRMARALVNPSLLAWVTPAAGLPSFDPAGFPASTDTLYALSREGEGSGGPFVAALTAHVCEAAERLAAGSVPGRLAVPMTVELDEAANIVRWPELPKLYSHYGSRGILLHTYLQSWTQGAEAWGEYGIRAMWSAATIRVLGAGVADEKFLSEFSSLIGDHEEWILQSVYTGRSGERQLTQSLRKDRALAVSDLASLPKDRAIVVASGSRPVVIKTVPWMDGPHATSIRAALASGAGS
ncbi:MAG: type IV secretory system conjugative DNA transfer family protein [Streptosporangiaceae bacterium]|nr:type IV secretory system conjugative DNA transfer family protein [Streptosporangiaceae bacterium]